MFIATIIPIQRGIPFDTLTYYSSEDIVCGAIVEIPFGRQTIYGLVLESVPLSNAKMSIKQATFSLKRVKRVVGASRYSESVTKGLLETKKKLLVPIGALAAVTLHELYFDLIQQTESTEALKRSQTLPPVIYGDTAARTDQYKRVIRSAFADKQSIIFIAPSIRALEYWYTQLKKGIGDHVVLIHSKRTKRDQKSALSAIKQSTRPLLICTTPHFAHIPRPDVGVMILEEESSSLYKTNDRYEIDMRVLLAQTAQAHGIHMIYSDVLPRFETLIDTQSPTLARSYVPEKVVIAPTEPYRSILPAETIELIRYCQKNKKTLFLYTNRKGIAPLSRCSDCGTIVECPTCTMPMLLRYKVTSTERERLFSCTHCGDTLPPTHTCGLCGSWNITPVSIGTDSLYEAVKSIVDEEYIVSIDDASSPDSADIEKMLSLLQKRKWYIMVGTQKLLPFIKSIDYTVIPFFDRLLSLPSPYTVEEILRLLFECNERTKENVVLCTRHPDFPLTVQIATRKIQTVIDEDIENRKTLSYPPFGTLLKLSVTVSSGHRESLVEKIESFFQEYDVSASPPRRISPQTMKLLCTWIISVPSTYLDDEHESVVSFLESLRLPYKIDTHPTRL